MKRIIAITSVAALLTGIASAQEAPFSKLRVGFNYTDFTGSTPAKFPEPSQKIPLKFSCNPEQYDAKNLSAWAKAVGGTFKENPPILTVKGLKLDCSGGKLTMSTSKVINDIADKGNILTKMYDNDYPMGLEYEGNIWNEENTHYFIIKTFDSGLSTSFALIPNKKTITPLSMDEGAVAFIQNGKMKEWFVAGGKAATSISYDPKKPFVISLYDSNKKIWYNVNFNLPSQVQLWLSSQPNGSPVKAPKQ